MPGNSLSDDAGSKLRGAEVVSQQFNRNFVSTVFTIHLQIYLFVVVFFLLFVFAPWLPSSPLCVYSEGLPPFCPCLKRPSGNSDLLKDSQGQGMVNLPK